MRHLVSEWEQSPEHKLYVSATTDYKGGESLDACFNDLFEHASESKCVLLLGYFGTGKTTFLREYTYRLAKASLAGDSASRTPIFISLKDCAVPETLPALVARTLMKHGVVLKTDVLADARLAGKLVLVLDAFDEMSLSPTRAEVQSNAQKILAVSQTRQGHLILSCRDSFFRDSVEPSQFAHFARVQVRKWTDAEIRQYIKAVTQQEWEIPEVHDLKDLARTPLFLKMILETRGQLGAGTVSSAALYETYTDQWIASQHSRSTLDRDDKTSFLAELAWEMGLQGSYCVPWKTIRDKLRVRFSLPGTGLDAFKHDIGTCSFLVAAPPDSYTFVHTSFLEYFMARHLAGLVLANAEGATKELSKVQPGAAVVDFMAQMLDNLDCCARLHGYLENYPGMEYALLRRNSAVTLRAMIRQPFRGSAADRATAAGKARAVLLHHPEAEEKRRAIMELGWYREPAARQLIGEALRRPGQDRRVSRIAEVVLGLLGNPADSRLLLERLKDSATEPVIRQNAAVALGLMGEVSRDHALDLTGRLADEPDGGVRRSMIWAIEMIDPLGAGPTLLHRALHDDDPEVREYSVLALARLGGVAAFSVLQQAMKDPISLVRKAVVQTAWQLGGSNARDILGLATDDKDPEVRDEARKALRALGAAAG
ncbi:MAG: HEAT repeat domain-containing protein [Candidatus Solibacter sp.]|nr:HEAT repeat domain-containing protein [Candidatus Solibacter sp.]